MTLRKKFCLFVGLTLTTGQVTANAAVGAAVSSLPEGMVTLAAARGSTTYLSLPLSNNAIFSGTVGAVGVSAISVTNVSDPFPMNLAASGSPYFVKFLSGNEKGRILLITANTYKALTLNTADNSTQQVSLLTSGYNVQAGDAFEIFPGDTLASIFGANTRQNPLALTGASTFASSDTVNVFNPPTGQWLTYYFNTKLGYWLREGLSANANATVLYPYQGLSITRRGGSEAVASLVLTGRVAEVPVVMKTTGSNVVVYGSTGYPVGMKLSQLKFGSNWATGTTTATADVVSVWNSSTRNFVSYFQLPDSTWRQAGNPTIDQSSTVVPAGACIAIEQHLKVSGATSYLPLAMPYSLTATF